MWVNGRQLCAADDQFWACLEPFWGDANTGGDGDDADNGGTTIIVPIIADRGDSDGVTLR